MTLHHSASARGLTAVALMLVGLAVSPTVTARTAWMTASAAPLADAPDTAFRFSAVRDTIVAVKSSSTASEASVSASASSAAALATLLRLEGESWIGIPYRWGGTTRRGIDCSAFVQQYMRSVLDVELTRTTASQRHEGVHVAKEDLQPGDLVFFRRRGTRHVGVYLGSGEFIHASTSRGVTVSTMEEGYWSRYYWMARRVTEAGPARPMLRAEAGGARRLRPTPRADARAQRSAEEATRRAAGQAPQVRGLW